MDLGSVSNLQLTPFNRKIHSDNEADREHTGVARASSAQGGENLRSGSSAMQQQLAGERRVRRRVQATLETIPERRRKERVEGEVPQTCSVPLDYFEVLDMKMDCYKLLKTAMQERMHKNITILTGGTTLLSFTVGYLISGKLNLLLTSGHATALAYSLYNGKYWHLYSKMHQELEEVLQDYGLKEDDIKYLGSLEFNEKGLREAARFLQEKMPENVYLSDAADDFVESYEEDPVLLKKCYAVTQRIMQTFSNDKRNS